MTGNSIILATSGETVERGGVQSRLNEEVLGDVGGVRRKERDTRGRKNERKRKPRLRVTTTATVRDLRLKDTFSRRKWNTMPPFSAIAGLI
jgi:hypothetical protein